jgi:hypothetical protein
MPGIALAVILAAAVCADEPAKDKDQNPVPAAQTAPPQPASPQQPPKSAPIDDKTRVKVQDDIRKIEGGENIYAEAKVSSQGGTDERPMWSRIMRTVLLYIPNRVIDLTDVFTINAGGGNHLAAKLYCTRFMATGGFVGNYYFMEKGFHRQYGFGRCNGWEMSALWFANRSKHIDKAAGTVRAYDAIEVFQQPGYEIEDWRDYLYREKLEDFWGVGFELGYWFHIGAALHPYEAVDIFAGALLIDLMNDDFEDTALIRVE